jgi:hypothetical protein
MKQVNCPRNLLNLEKKLFIAGKKEEFYSEYQTLIIKLNIFIQENQIKSRVLPEIIDYYKTEKAALDLAKSKLKNVINENENKFVEEHRIFIQNEKEQLNKSLSELKNKEKQGIISHKAYETESDRLKHRSKEDIKLHRGTISKNHYKG